MKIFFKLPLFIFFAGLFFANGILAQTGAHDVDYSDKTKTIQFNVKSILNARAVTTCFKGGLISWNKGIDDTWSGLATRTAADSMGSKDKIALPNNGAFEATKYHPYVQMNFSNGDEIGNQIRFSDKNSSDSYSFFTYENSYSHLSLYFMSAFGTSEITVEIYYSDKTVEKRNYNIEDWAFNIPESDTKYFLASNLAKWGSKNTELEKDKHYLMGIDIKPTINKKVMKVTIKKIASETTLTFWGATGYISQNHDWTLPANSSIVLIEGRSFILPDGTVELGYPGIVTRVNFKGTALSMRARTSSDELYLDIIIDDAPPVFMKVPKGETEVILAKGLSKVVHRLAIYKRIESCVGVLDIISFTVAGEFFLPIRPPDRKLLFMGDSFTTGQATTVEDGGSMDPSKAMRQNARLSYPRLLANKLNAQCHIIGYAGRGLVRDWQGLINVRCAPEYYEYALPDDASTKWNPEKYVPDAIGVCIGNNDFGVGVPDQISYVAAYTEFIRKLRRDAPNAHIFLITSPSLTDEPGKVPMRTVQLAYLEEIAKRVGDSRIHVVQIAHYNGVPNDWHPSGTAHRAVADELEKVFKKELNWAK